MYKSLIRAISQMIQLTLIILIKIYQNVVSSWFISCCRFYPNCSSYAEEAIKQFGATKGVYLSVYRLLRCHPFHLGGVDLVPKKHEKIV